MIRRLAALVAVALLLGARPLPEYATSPAGSQTDLDTFSDTQLLRDLRDELDDILEGRDPNENVAADELFDEVMVAIDDAGDDGDPEESEISLTDLENEMEEAGTCVEDVVREIVGMAKEGCDGTLDIEVQQPRGGPGTTDTGGAWLPPRRDVPSRGAVTFQRYVRARR